MHRRYGLLTLLTAIIVLAAACFGFRAFDASGLPFAVQIVDARTGVIEPLSGLALPEGLHAGERLDLEAQPRSTRIAIAELDPNGQLLPTGQLYGFAIDHGLTAATVSVRANSLEGSAGQAEQRWLELFESLLTGAIALAAVWRGRSRAAAGLALFATTFLAGRAVNSIPCAGAAGLAAVLGGWVLFLFARAGFYVMAESMADAAVSPRARAWWRGGFLLLLGAGAVVAWSAPLLYVTTGWAELLRPRYGLVLSASYLAPVALLFYLVPIALLFGSYRRAQAAQRLRLRWMLGSSVMFSAGIFLINTPILGFVTSIIAQRFPPIKESADDPFLSLGSGRSGATPAMNEHPADRASVRLGHEVIQTSLGFGSEPPITQEIPANVRGRTDNVSMNCLTSDQAIEHD